MPEPGEFTAADAELLATADGLLERVRASFDAQAMHLALEAIWLMLGEANRYFSAQQPWVLRKSESEADQTRFRTVLYTTCEAVRIAALLVQPVMPDSAGKLLDLLGQADDQRTFDRRRRAAGPRHGAATADRRVPPLPASRRGVNSNAGNGIHRTETSRSANSRARIWAKTSCIAYVMRHNRPVERRRNRQHEPFADDDLEAVAGAGRAGADPGSRAGHRA